MKRKSYSFLIIIASILWSIDALLRRQLYTVPPASVVFYEYLISAVLLFPLFKKFLKEYRQMTIRDWIVMMLVGVVGGALGTFFFTSALGQVDNISYSLVVLLQQTQPIFAVAFAALLLKEKITPQYLFLATIGLMAAYCLAFPDLRPNLIHQPQEIAAAVLAMGAAVFWGASNALGKMVLNRLSFYATAILRFTLAIPLAFLTALILHQTYAFSAILPQQWLSLLSIALTSGMVAFLIFYKGLQFTQAKIAAVVKLCWPLFAAVIGWLFLKESLNLIQTIAAIVLSGDILLLSVYQISHENS